MGVAKAVKEDDGGWEGDAKAMLADEAAKGPAVTGPVPVVGVGGTIERPGLLQELEARALAAHGWAVSAAPVGVGVTRFLALRGAVRAEI